MLSLKNSNNRHQKELKAISFSQAKNFEVPEKNKNNISEYLFLNNDNFKETNQKAKAIKSESYASHFKIGFHSSRDATLDGSNLSEAKNKFMKYD